MKSLEKKITGFLRGQKSIAVAYLFGSQMTGLTHPGSDIDVGLLYSRGEQPDMDGVLLLRSELSGLLRRETDVVILNNASPIIKMQVLKKGKKVYEKDHGVAIEFFVRTVNEYDDLKKVRAVTERNIERGRIYD